jgi:hypothetical protein
VGQQAADEVVADLRQAVTVGGVGEGVAPARGAVRQEVGERGVQVSAVAGLVGDRLGRQGGPQAVPERHATDRLPVQHVVVGGAQRVRVPDGKLVLAVAEFGVIVLDFEALRLHRGDEFHGEVVTLMKAGGGVAQAVIKRDEPVRYGGRGGRGFAVADGELGLERGLHRVARAGQLGDGLFEERPRARLPRRPVRVDQVREHRGGPRRVGERDKRIRVRHDPDLADRAHPGHRLQLVQHGHRHHRHRVADAAGHPFLQPRGARGFSADDPAVVGVQEADQANPFLASPLHHGFGCSVCHAPWVARSTPSRTADARTCPTGQDRIVSAHEPTAVAP